MNLRCIRNIYQLTSTFQFNTHNFFVFHTCRTQKIFKLDNILQFSNKIQKLHNKSIHAKRYPQVNHPHLIHIELYPRPGFKISTLYTHTLKTSNYLNPPSKKMTHTIMALSMYNFKLIYQDHTFNHMSIPFHTFKYIH